MSGASQGPDRPVTFVEQSPTGIVGSFYWDPETGTEAVLIFAAATPSLPLEQRAWRSSRPRSPIERREILEGFSADGKVGLSDEARRSIPWGSLHSAQRSFVGSALIDSIESFRPPSKSTIDFLTFWGDLPSTFRSSRDLAAHASELRCVKEYLLAVYRDQSPSPAERVAEIEEISVARARNLIDRARQHGYLTRVEGGVGGAITEKAFAVAGEISTAETLTMMREKFL